jgi:hypothetical protein
VQTYLLRRAAERDGRAEHALLRVVDRGPDSAWASRGSEPHPKLEIAPDLNVAPKPPLGPLDRPAGVLPILELVVCLRPWPERIARVGDLVLRAVASDLADTGLPLLLCPRLVGPLTEGVSHPRSGRPKLALGELVTDLGVLSRGLPDRALESIALSPYLGRVAQLASRSARRPITA